MLPKQYRLKKRAAFLATYKTGKTFYKNGITVFVGKEKTWDIPTKVGFVVSKKTHKRAVKRNRIKRLMRESYRLLIKKDLANNKYLSIIFVASSKSLNQTFYEINSTIQALLEQI